MLDINLSCQEIKTRIDQGDDLVLLDVRENMEVSFCAIDGSLHIPMGEIPGRLKDLDPDKQIVVYCHHGMRSMQVATYLKMNGFDTVYNLAGGIDAWSNDIDPNVPRYR